ncbi:MAG TPA: DUF4342 domain-containing protein [Candidatus Saccharimonadales bacterium]
MTDTKKTTEEFSVNGDELLAKVKSLINEGNIRRVIIKDADGKTLIEFPVTVGVIGAVLVPIWAAIGAIAALVTKCTIVVERREE